MKRSHFSDTAKAQNRLHLPKKVWVPSSVLLVIIAIPVLLLGWMGLIPGLSNLMGSASQRDLGVSFTQESLAGFQQKMPLELIPSNLGPASPAIATDNQLLAQPNSVQNVTLSQEDITATLNSYHLSWMPLDNIQVRLTSGTVEMSGLLNHGNINAFEEYVANGHALNPNVAAVINWSKYFRNNVPVYFKAHVSVTDDILSFKLEQAQIGRFDVPFGPSLNGATLHQGILATIRANNLHIQTAYATSGALQFSGTYPSVIYIKD